VAADKLLRTPDSYADAKEQEGAWNQVYDRLGRPKSAAEYGFESKDNAENMKFVADTFHKAGLRKKQAEDIAKAFGEKETAQQKATLEYQQNLNKQSVEKLKQEWGGTYENNTQVAKQGQKALGWDDKRVDSVSSVIGIGETMKMLNDVGRRVGEGQFIEGNKGNPITHTPETAQTKINQLRSDKVFTDRLMSGDLQARAQWDMLHQQWSEGKSYT
jgi:hypothetical protein